MQSLQPAASSYSQAGRRNAGLPTSACDLRVCAEGEAGPLQSTLACLRTFASLFSDRRVPLPAVPNDCLLAGEAWLAASDFFLVQSSKRARVHPLEYIDDMTPRTWSGMTPAQIRMARAQQTRVEANRKEHSPVGAQSRWLLLHAWRRKSCTEKRIKRGEHNWLPGDAGGKPGCGEAGDGLAERWPESSNQREADVEFGAQWRHTFTAARARMLLLVLCGCLASAGAAARKAAARRQINTVAESIFFQGTDGWTVGGANFEQRAHVDQPVARTDALAIEVVDRHEMWYFTSGHAFVGDKTAAYNGELSFKLYHHQLPAASRSQHMKLGRVGVESADVILEAQCGHALYIGGVLERARGVPTEYVFPLTEEAGWIDSRTGNPPLQLDMLGVLANLNAVKIRGAFYRETETVRLQDVRLSGATKGSMSGRDLFPCCSGTFPGEMDVCVQGAQNTDLTPKGIAFDCKGSFKEIIKIKTIYPRFARRSGGTMVTVTGENFGLSGSSTILRVNGKPARSCSYPTTEFIAGNAPPPTSELEKHCINGEWDQGEDGIDCGGDDCPLCMPRILPDHCLNGVLEEHLGETSRGSTQDNMGKTHDCGGPCLQPDTCCDDSWQEFESGQNCGGPYCMPCNVPVLPAGTAVERAVLTHGKMSARGCFCFVHISNMSVSCPSENSTAWMAAERAVVPTPEENTLYWDTESETAWGPHKYMDAVGTRVNASDCQNVIYLDEQDPVHDGNDYVGKYIIITGGPGSGQRSKIIEYNAKTKWARVETWSLNGELRDASVNTQTSTWYKVGWAEVKQSGSGYSDGVWRIPGNIFNDTETWDFKPIDAWGYFKTNRGGNITSVEIVNMGLFATEYWDGTRGIYKVEYVRDEDIYCTRECPDSAGAQIWIDFQTNEIVAPNNESTYMIVSEEDLLASPRGIRSGRITGKPGIGQHETLICEVDAGDGSDHQFDIQSFDQMGTPVSSCYSDFSRGFEFGAHEYTWSLQVGIRQGEGVREVVVSAIEFDKNSGDIYITGKIVGSCNEGVIGCFGVLGAHLPDRGRSASGDFNPLFLDPHGTISSFVMKFDKYAKPQWATMIDSQSQFSRIVASSLAVDSTRTSPNIYIAGNYLTPTNTYVRFWHVNELTKRPTRIPRSEVDIGGGSCNQVLCDGAGGDCTSTLPANDQFKCADRFGGYQDLQSCRISRCAFITGFDSRDETQDDVWLAEISPQGRWKWVKTRIGFSRRGFTLLDTSGMLKLATTAAGYNAPLAESGSAIYMSLTLEVKAHSWGDLTFKLGHVAHEFWGIDVDEEDLDIIQITLPQAQRLTRYGLLVRFSQGGVLWSRRIGPLGENGDLRSLKTDGSNLFIAGSYKNVSENHSKFAFDSCKFGHQVHAQGYGQHASTQNSVAQTEMPHFTNTMCFPFGKMYAHYTFKSWQRSKPQQWDDISGNERHGATSRGTVKVGWRAPSFGADSLQFYLRGTQDDGMIFPEDSIPSIFTICSVSRMPVISQGTILDSVTLEHWAHGHYGGHPGQAWYGTVEYQTDTGLDQDGGHSWGGQRVLDTDWVIMCGQNRELGSHPPSVFMANGVNTSLGTSGGYGGGQLSINHGHVSSTRGYSEWEVIELAIWDYFLSEDEVKAVMMHYQHLLRDGADKMAVAQMATFSPGVKNLFLASYTLDGELRWHRQAINGNLSTTALAVSQPNLTLGGIDNVRIKKGTSLARDEVSTHWVYVAGSVHGERNPADFGVTEFPLDCSSGKRLGNHLTAGIVKQCVDNPVDWKDKANNNCEQYKSMKWCVDGGYGPAWAGEDDGYNSDGISAASACCECGGGHFGDEWIDRSPCSGQIFAKGQHTDVFLAKYSADTGRLAWLKRLGQSNTVEVPVDIITDDYNQEIVVVGDYYHEFTTNPYLDVFDLIAAGRPADVGCLVDRIDKDVKQRLGTILTDDQVGYPNCSLVGNSMSGRQISAFIASVDARNMAHGTSHSPSRPASSCTAAAELGCNADGLLWARTFGSGIREASTRVSTRASGLAKTPYRNQILAWGIFSGFIVATGTRGIKTQGVDDEGFFNCCIKLNIPLTFNELQDVWESYIFALES